MERPKRGIVIEDIETPLRVVLREFVNVFSPIYREGAAKLEISFGLVKDKTAIIVIGDNKEDRVEYRYESLTNSWGAFPLHRLLNNHDGVCDEIIDMWKKVRVSNPSQSNGVSNKILFNLINFNNASKANTLFLDNILATKDLKNLKKIKMKGLSETFDNFMEVFQTSHTKIFSVGDKEAYDKYCAKTLTTLVNKNGLSFECSNPLIVESFFLNENIKKNVSPDLIELAYSDMTKNKTNSIHFLYKSLSNLIDMSSVKTKEFKRIEEAKSLGDSNSIVVEKPSNFDSFFLSRKYIEGSFNFKTSRNEQEYTDSDYKSNLNFVFSILARKEYQPLTGVVGVEVQSINNMFFFMAETNEKKYNRDNFISEAKELIIFMNKLTELDPLNGTGLLTDYMTGQNSKNFAKWQKDMVKDRNSKLSEFITLRKRKNKVEKIMDLTSADNKEDSSSNSFSFKM